MPSESIQCLYQDKIGIFWLGTESIGLTKYDGETTTIYSHNPLDDTSISSNYPAAILEDKNDCIWVASSNGLNKFNRQSETFTRFFHSDITPNSLSSNIINDMIVDNNGFIWLATANGVNILNTDRQEFTHLLFNPKKENIIDNIIVNVIYKDSDENIWIGSATHGLFLIKSNDYIPTLKKWNNSSASGLSKSISNIYNWKINQQNIKIRDINALASGSSNTLWIGSQEGLFYFDINNEQFKKWEFNKSKHNHLNLAAYSCLFIDSNNNIWAGTSNNGLVILNAKQGTYQLLSTENKTFNNLNSNSIRDITESSNNIIWIATKFGGLHYYDKRQHIFPLITKDTKETPGLNDNFAICSIEDLNHNIWIGTKTGGLNKYNRKLNNFKYFTADGRPGSIQSNRVEALVLDKQGAIWIATQSGLERMHPDTLIFKNYVPKHIRNLLYTSDNYLWLGTDHGIYRFSCKDLTLSPLTTRHTSFFDVENNIAIGRIFEDSQGIIWIATSSNGLYEYHPSSDSLINHLNNPNDSSSISGNQVRSICEDSNNTLWIGTKSNGLNSFDLKQRRFKRITGSHNLTSMTIYHILEDKKGKLWMGTHNGIVEYDPYNGNCQNYSTIYGLQSLIFETNSFCATHDGLFLMGGHNGINIFDPLKVKYETKKRSLIISKIKVNNQPIAREVSSFRSFYLDRKSNYLSFEFALLDYTSTNENMYAFMLAPFDKEWIHAGTRNYATYTNLSPGKYTFYVKSSNNTGIWDEDSPLAVEIIIPTPFWKQWWFITLIIILIIAIVSLTNHIRLRTIRRREILLTQIVKERTKDLEEAYRNLKELNEKIEAHNKKLRIQRDHISSQNKELENHRQHLELMVSNRTKDLEMAKHKAEDSDRLKSAFLANMSHEIRTPLNAIMGFIDLMQAGQIEDGEKKHIHEIIQSNGHSLLQLINDIIDISIIEANQVVIIKRSIEFDKFLTEIKTHYYSNKDLSDGIIKLNLSLPNTQNSLMINTAPDRVHQIFTNLINNAIKFTEKGEITFGYTNNVENNQITCFVKDPGCGISKENQKLLFERFMKIDVDQSKIHRGTGLGLSISKNLCELLGGEIWVESEPGQGSEFYFTLPYDSVKDENQRIQNADRKTEKTSDKNI